MILSDRMAVMDKGQVRQVGSPTDIYEYPGNKFVAGFIGSINFAEGRVTDLNSGLASVDVPAMGGRMSARAVAGIGVGDSVTLAVRPEKITISRDRPDTGNAMEGVVSDLGYFGKDSLYKVALASGTVLSVSSVNARRVGESGRVADWEDKVWLSFDPASAILLKE